MPGIFYGASVRAGRLLRELRVRASISQRDLALQSGMDADTIRHIEKGRRGLSADYLNILAQALQLNATELDTLIAAFAGLAHTGVRPTPPPPTVLRIVVASPGDVQKERDYLPQVLEELNKGVASELRLKLELWRWETDAYPGFHAGGPQGQIDDSMRVENADVVIGIFWRRFGTPTGEAKSGTEHELTRAYAAWKSHGHPHIMLYFSKRPYSPNDLRDLDQWRAVFRFRNRFANAGLWWTYSGPAEFRALVTRHLDRLLRERYKPQDGEPTVWEGLPSSL